VTGRIVQLTPLPLPAGYAPPADLKIEPAFDAAALEAVDPTGVLAVVTHSIRGVPAEVWERFGDLKLVANFGVGLDRIDLEAARRRGVSVSYTPDHLTADVADLAVALTLALLRRLPAADAFVRRNGWAEGPYGLGTSAKGRRLGVIGLGRIGRAVAERAQAFGMDVAYASRTAKDAALPFFATAAELAAWCDVLVAAVPGGAGTDRMVDAEVLGVLGKDGLFINVARSSVVDEDALVEALRQGVIAGAGLELFDPASTLPSRLQDQNVIFTPHIGSATVQTRSAMADSVFGNVRAALDGRPFSDLAV
jgi:lactate dehydrogenase-like 2-hydroxyacid dehydrogenase